MISLYHHTLDIPFFQYTGPREYFVRELWMKGKVEHGCFWEWHRGWRTYWEKNKERVLWVTFEDFKDNPERVIRDVTGFLDLNVGDDVINATVSGCSFSAMKSNASIVTSIF